MTLGEKQELFSILLGNLLLWLSARGYKIRCCELYRPPEMAEIYAERGTGIKNSLHCLKLAIDLVINKDDEDLFDLEDYREAGMWWKAQHPLCRWGGDFRGKVARDAGHFSITHNGVQ